jgi:hypothetical protein
MHINIASKLNCEMIVMQTIEPIPMLFLNGGTTWTSKTTPTAKIST